jgi:hypothetical protein
MSQIWISASAKGYACRSTSSGGPRLAIAGSGGSFHSRLQQGPAITERKLLDRIEHLEPMANKGREAAAYLHHLLFYPHCNSEGFTNFSQGASHSDDRQFSEMLQCRDSWGELQSLSSGRIGDGAGLRPSPCFRESSDWIGGSRVFTEPFSTCTLGRLASEDEPEASRFRNYRNHLGIPKSWSIAGHFLELCGLDDLAECAWRATLVTLPMGLPLPSETIDCRRFLSRESLKCANSWKATL